MEFWENLNWHVGDGQRAENERNVAIGDYALLNALANHEAGLDDEENQFIQRMFDEDNPWENEQEQRPPSPIQRGQGILDDIARYYTVRQQGNQFNRRFQLVLASYECKVQRLATLPAHMIFPAVTAILESLLNTLLENVRDHDFVRVHIYSRELHHPIWTPLIRKDQLTVDRWMFEIERVLNSNQTFRLDETFQIWIQHTNLPAGNCDEKVPEMLRRKLEKLQCVARIRNKDNLCLPRAIAVAKVLADGSRAEYKRIYNGEKKQKQSALELIRLADLPLRAYTIEDVHKFQEALNEYQIIVISTEHLNSVVYAGPFKEKHINLLHHGSHFDVLNSVPGWFNSSYYCFHCLKHYDHKTTHRCQFTCNQCLRRTACQRGDVERIECTDCNRKFYGQACFDEHKKRPAQGRSLCERVFVCKDCHKFISLEKHNRTHRCAEVFCAICSSFSVPEDNHRCFIKPVKVTQEDYYRHSMSKRMYFDFETTKQDDNIFYPNLAVIWVDGEVHKFPDLEENPELGRDITEELCNFIFQPRFADYVVIAHNLKSFDGYFILKHLIKVGIVPKVIFNGSKLLQLDIPQHKIRFRDSLNYVPASLDNFAKTFGVPISKSKFPFSINIPEYWNTTMPWPSKASYDFSLIPNSKRKAFNKWYRKERRRKKNAFNFNEEFFDYCVKDVLVLQQACEKFRDLFMLITGGLCPFESGLTIAGVCNYFWRAKILEPNQICLVAPQSQANGRKRSVIGEKWLRYIESEENISIDREVRVGRWTVDGRDPATGTCFEFLGCMWHGCPKCSKPHVVHPFQKISMREIHRQTEERLDEIRNMTTELRIIWEHDALNDVDFVAFTKTIDIVEPLNPRDALYGGRTNAVKLYHKCDLNIGEEIRSVDIISQYPFINKTAKYPIGSPVYYESNFPPVETLFGIIKCRILPPQNLLHPPLPYRTEKLTFPLCRSCVQRKTDEECSHDETERALTGTWCTPEIHKALEMGYRILDIYSVLHYSEQKVGLFQKYIDLFYKIKTEASGFPPEITNVDQQDDYIRRFHQKEGIHLDKDKILKNDGLRSLAKYMLNSFWGKLGEQDLRGNSVFVEKPEEFYNYLLSGKFNVSGFELMSDEILQVSYKMKSEFAPTNVKANVVLAAFTTSYARLLLYKYMVPLGDRLLYTDTDSLFYIHRPGEPDPDLGDCLGDLSNSLKPGEFIVEMASLGPKCYSVLNNYGRQETKAKGFSVSRESQRRINHSTLKDLLFASLELTDTPPDPITVDYPFVITRSKRSLEVAVTSLSKRLKLTYDKRRIISHETFATLPYGFKTD